MIITEVMAPQVPDINGSGCGSSRSESSSKVPDIVLYKFTLALVDFVFTFLFIHTFTLFLSVTHTLYGVTVFIVPLKIMSPRTKFPREICPPRTTSLGKTVPSLVKNVPFLTAIKKFEKSMHTIMLYHLTNQAYAWI